MAGKKTTEINKVHDQARARANEAIAKVLSRKPVEPGATAAALKRMIADQEQRITAAKASRDLAVQRFEGEIKAREQRIEALKAFAKDIEGGGSTPTPGPTPAPTPSPIPRQPGVQPERGLELGEIDGIGPVAERRLREGDIDSVAALSRARPARVAELLNVSREKAASFIAEAKRLLKG